MKRTAIFVLMLSSMTVPFFASDKKRELEITEKGDVDIKKQRPDNSLDKPVEIQIVNLGRKILNTLYESASFTMDIGQDDITCSICFCNGISSKILTIDTTKPCIMSLTLERIFEKGYGQKTSNNSLTEDENFNHLYKIIIDLAKERSWPSVKLEKKRTQYTDNIVLAPPGKDMHKNLTYFI